MSFIIPCEQFIESSKKYVVNNDIPLLDYHIDNEIETYMRILDMLNVEKRRRFTNFAKIYYDKLCIDYPYSAFKEQDKLFHSILLQYFLCP